MAAVHFLNFQKKSWGAGVPHRAVLLERSSPVGRRISNAWCHRVLVDVLHRNPASLRKNALVRERVRTRGWFALVWYGPFLEFDHKTLHSFEDIADAGDAPAYAPVHCQFVVDGGSVCGYPANNSKALGAHMVDKHKVQRKKCHFLCSTISARGVSWS